MTPDHGNQTCPVFWGYEYDSRLDKNGVAHDSTMDLHNNMVGRAIGREVFLQITGTPVPPRPDPVPLIRQALLARIAAGDLLVIGEDHPGSDPMELMVVRSDWKWVYP